jgi:hypothetical protein
VMFEATCSEHRSRELFERSPEPLLNFAASRFNKAKFDLRATQSGLTNRSTGQRPARSR